MASAPQFIQHQTIAAQCECAGEIISLELDALTPDGCEVVPTSPWHGDCDFVRLLIDGRVTINGQVAWRSGNRAGVRFFGQIHPVVVDELNGRAG
jgi:hypothetical protein